MRLFILFVFAASAISAQATTTTLDFDHVTETGTVVFEEGYKVENNSGFLANVPISGGIGLGVAGGPAELTQVGGGTFSIFSMDVWEDAAGDGINVTGYLLGGGTVGTTFTATGPAVANYSFGSEWQNLTLVEFATFSSSGSPAIIDNIVVSAVPAPAAVWLFGSALAGLAWLRRRSGA